MNKQETAALLAWAQGIDSRPLTEFSARAWHQLVGHVPFDEGLAAVQQHYREEHRWIMPSDVLERCAPDQPRYGVNATAELMSEQKQAWCEAHGVTVEEFDEHEGDVEWIEAVSRRG